MAAANFFAVIDGVLVTPKLGTILPGITRDSIIQVAHDSGLQVTDIPSFPARPTNGSFCSASPIALLLQVEEADITLEDVQNASEAFCAGTAAVVTPISSIAQVNGDEIVFPEGNTVCNKMRQTITDIQYGRIPDPFGWVREIEF